MNQPIHHERVRAEVMIPETVSGRKQAERLAGAFLAGYSNPLTRDAYRRDLIKWFDFGDALNIHLLEPHRSHIDLYLRQMEMDGLMPASISRRLTALSCFYQWLVDEDLVRKSPMPRVRRPKIPSNVPRAFLGRHELADWLDAAEELGGYDYALACLLALNGLRIGEIVRADVDDLSTERHHTTLDIFGKGSKPDRVPLTARTSYAVFQAIDGREKGPLILNRAGRRINRENGARTVVRITKAAGIRKYITPHSLRRSAITGLLDSGVDLRDAQDFARHQDPATTRRYDQRGRSLERHGAYALERYVAAGSDR